MEIFDTAGRRVDRLDLGVLTAGSHGVEWNAGDAPGGVYLVRMSSADGNDMLKLTLLK